MNVKITKTKKRCSNLRRMNFRFTKYLQRNLHFLPLKKIDEAQTRNLRIIFLPLDKLWSYIHNYIHLFFTLFLTTFIFCYLSLPNEANILFKMRSIFNDKNRPILIKQRICAHANQQFLISTKPHFCSLAKVEIAIKDNKFSSPYYTLKKKTYITWYVSSSNITH